MRAREPVRKPTEGGPKSAYKLRRNAWLPWQEKVVNLQVSSRRKKLREMQIVKINLRFLVSEKHLNRILGDDIAFHGIREVVRRAEINTIWILGDGTAPRYRRQDVIEPLDATREGRCQAATSGLRTVALANQIRGGDTPKGGEENLVYETRGGRRACRTPNMASPTRMV